MPPKKDAKKKSKKSTTAPPSPLHQTQVDSDAQSAPPAKKRVIESHQAADQPDAGHLDALIGPPLTENTPPQTSAPRPVAVPVVNSSWLDISQRVGEATERARNHYHNGASVAARYANIDSVREFLTASSNARADTGGASSSSHNTMRSQAQDRSLIDDMLAASNNALAAAATQKSRAKPGSIGAVLDDRTKVTTIEDFASRILGMTSLTALADEMLRDPFVVEGLSMREPNPDWTALERERAALLQRREDLVREQRVFIDGRNVLVRPESTVAEDRTRERLRIELMEIGPLDSVELLKPASEVRALNERWRELLGQALVTIYAQYRDKTSAALVGALGPLADREDSQNLAALYLQRVVTPVFDEYLERLRSATYEDMPLTLETLKDYFYRFMNIALRATLRDKATRGEDELKAVRERAEHDVATNVAEALEADAQRWRDSIRGEDDDESSESELFDDTGVDTRTMSSAEREQNIVTSYLRQALYIYATPIYIEWFDRWLVEVITASGADVDEASIATLRRSVQAMVTGRENTYLERNRVRSLPRYEPQRERLVVMNYARLINNKVAQRRIDTLIQQDDASALRNAIDYALVGATPATDDPDSIQLPIEVLLYPRADRFEILQAALSAQEAEVERAYQSGLRNYELMGDDDDVEDLAALDTARTAAIDDARARSETLREQLRFYSPRESDNVKEHGPRDEAADGFSPFDLSYPLDITRTRRQLNEANRLVASLDAQYDANAIHERADELRSLLSYGYAEQLIMRDIMRIDYTLQHLAQPERDAPLQIDRSLASARPLELTARVRLRDEILLASQSPSADMLDDRIANIQSRLEDSRWRVRWYFKARYGDQAGVEQLVYTELLPVGATGARYLRASLPGNPLQMAGLYWAVFDLPAAESADDELARRPAVSVRSRFTGSVRVMAHCRRTGQLFEVGAEYHGQAQWVEWPRDKLTREVSEEWLVQVTRGDASLRELYRQRAANAAVEGREVAQLYLPPWGTEDEANLLRAFSSLQPSEFTFNGIFSRAVERIGADVIFNFRRILANKTTPIELVRVITPFVNKTPVAIFAALADAAIPRPGSEDFKEAVRYLQLRGPEQAAHGADSDKTIGNGATRIDLLPLDLSKVDISETEMRSRVEALVALFQRVSAVPTTEAPALYPGEAEFFDPEALPVEAVRRLGKDYKRGVEQMPLATLLLALQLLSSVTLTWRERRFLLVMQRRFEEFARDYRARMRRELRYSQIMQDQPWSVHARRPLSYDNDRSRPVQDGDDAPALMSAAIEAEIDRRLSGMTAEAIKNQLGRRQYSIGDRYTDIGYRSTADMRSGQDSYENQRERQLAATFLVDVDLKREFEELVDRRLVRTGLLTVEKEFTTVRPAGREVDSRSFYPVDVVRHNPAGDAARRAAMANRGGRATWVGACSYRTDQPDIYRVAIDETRGAAIEQRGSTPLGKGYDFDGLHEYIVATVRQYTSVVRETATDGMTAQARERVKARLKQRLLDLELIYNFLAFVAHPLSGSLFVRADDIVHLLDGERPVLFQRIAATALSGGSVSLA